MLGDFDMSFYSSWPAASTNDSDVDGCGDEMGNSDPAEGFGVR